MQERPVTIIDALASLAPGEGWIIVEEDYDSIEWFRSDIPKPSIEELNAEIERLSLEKDELKRVAKEQEEAQIAAKQSALQKLSALGLTEEEAKAIVGL